MDSTRSDAVQDEDLLSRLAMQFRGSRSDESRREIASKYAEAVRRLIDGGEWAEMPNFDDQLPDEWMPAAFLEFWK